MSLLLDALKTPFVSTPVSLIILLNFAICPHAQPSGNKEAGASFTIHSILLDNNFSNSGDSY